MSIRNRYFGGLAIAAFGAAISLAGCDQILGLLGQPPTASFSVSPSSSVVQGTQVTLDASGSSDPQSYSLSYSWGLSKPSGSTASLSANNLAIVTFTPDIPGYYTAALTVKASSSSAQTDTTSKTIVATAIEGPAVEPPSGLTATPSATTLSIALSWTASPTSGVTYNVYRSEASGGEGAAFIESTAATAFTDDDENFSGSTTYYYSVTAMAEGTESEASNEASATTAATGPIGVVLQ